MTNETAATVAADNALQVEKVEEQKVEATETAEVSPQPAEETSEEKEARKAAKVQRRIDQLTRKVYEAQARAEALERMYSQPQAQPQEGKEEDLESIIERKVTEREQQKQAQSFAEKSQSILEKAAEIGDFDIEDFIPIPKGAADALVELDNPKLVAHLQKNPELIDELSKMSNYRQAVEIGKLEAKLSAPVAVKKSGAPTPIKPIAGSSAKETDLSKITNTEEWMAERNRQLKNR